jgi:hypothetical protein
MDASPLPPPLKQVGFGTEGKKQKCLLGNLEWMKY